MKKKYYLYAGYYELWISDKRIGAPLTYLSWHKSVENAVRAAERYDREACIIIDADIAEEFDESECYEIAQMAEYAA